MVKIVSNNLGSLKDHFGFVKKNTDSEKTIWFHAASVGEILSIAPLIREFSDKKIILSVCNKSAYELAFEKYKEVWSIIYLPLDIPHIIHRTLRRIKPMLLVIAEVEIWPALIRETARSKIPIIMVNGVMPDSDYKTYKRFSFLFKRVLANYSFIGVQSERFRTRFIKIGVNPQLIKITGNMKFDIKVHLDTYFVKEIREKFTNKVCLICAGSTHAGEEEIFIRVFDRLRNEPNIISSYDLRFIIAPRHTNRAGVVKLLCEKKNYNTIFYSELINEIVLDIYDIIIVDTMGDLLKVYAVSDIVLMGGTYTWMGHNIIEPAYLSKPVITGPNMQNFPDIIKVFIENNGVLQADTEDVLFQELKMLILDPVKREKLGKSAKHVVETNRGVFENNVKIIKSFL